jgi:Bifunctional DNA primase/polymerase, N-terminal/Primase C terminal 1 (PriCT-1)
MAPTSKQYNTACLLARQGFKVFPCIPRTKEPACAWSTAATKDWPTIKSWWTENSEYNVGLVTGKPSGFFVLDIDNEDAEAALKALESELGALPETVEAITARGRHLYFKMPAAADISNSKVLGPGLDIKATGGYVMAPSSVHPSGKVYAWSVDCAKSIAMAPDWLICRITKRRGANGKGKPEAQPATVWRELFLNGVDEGARDDSATKLTGYLAFRRLDPYVVLDVMQLWNANRCRPPLPESDIERIVNSVYGAENRKRGL